MPLNKAKGNMYPFVTDTWNTVKGACYHDCSYCYMKKWGKLNPVRFDIKELKSDLGAGNFVFVGSSCDMFSEFIPEHWIESTLEHCRKYDNDYLFQTKNPKRMNEFIGLLPKKSVVCTTIETNREYQEIMRRCPLPTERVFFMNDLAKSGLDTYVTIEPIMDFDLMKMVEMISRCLPKQVNIGADSKRSNLPEPPPDKVRALIYELNKFTKVLIKDNLKRITKT